MGRKKAEFKNLGTLPAGKWKVIQAAESGTIILTSEGKEPMVVSDGKLTTLVASMGGKPEDATEES